MGKAMRLWLTAAVLGCVLLARVLYPYAAEALRRETARILAADANELGIAQALGRAMAEENWREELVAVIRQGIGESGA